MIKTNEKFWASLLSIFLEFSSSFILEYGRKPFSTQCSKIYFPVPWKYKNISKNWLIADFYSAKLSYDDYFISSMIFVNPILGGVAGKFADLSPASFFNCSNKKDFYFLSPWIEFTRNF